MKKKLFVIIILFFVFANIWATGIVPEETAKKVAINFYFESIQSFKKTNLSDLAITDTYLIKENNIPVYYVFNMSNQGHIYVSAYDNIHPVLGYSFEGIYTNTDFAPAYVDFMHNFKEQIINAQNNHIEASQKIKDAWAKYTNNNFVPSKSITAVGQLLTTTWDQSPYYNDLCPAGPTCAHTKAGCLAVAMAQIMKYHNYPASGTGTHSYPEGENICYNEIEPSLGIISATFSTYGWASMPNVLTAPNIYVARLIYNCGVSASMNYGCCESAAGVSVEPWVNHFKYYISARNVYKSGYSNTDWQNLLVQELNAYRPILYYSFGSAGGHAYVCDGYQNSTYFHFNWGWGGDCDGYFHLNDLTPGSITLNDGQAAIINIRPIPPMEGPSIVCNNSTNNFFVQPVLNASYNWSLPSGFTIVNSVVKSSTPPETTSGSPTVYIKAPSTGSGYYTISCTISIGNSLTQTVSKTILLDNPPAATFLSTPDGEEKNHVEWKINPVVGAFNYSWSYVVDDGLPGGLTLTPSSSGTSCDIYCHINSEGSYYIKVQASNGCGSGPVASHYFAVTPWIHPENITLSISDKTPGNSFSIFPNPNNSGIFNLSSTNNIKSDISVYDLMGNIVYQITNFTISNEKIDLSSFAKGVYFIKITNENNIFLDKLIYQ